MVYNEFNTRFTHKIHPVEFNYNAVDKLAHVRGETFNKAWGYEFANETHTWKFTWEEELITVTITHTNGSDNFLWTEAPTNEPDFLTCEEMDAYGACELIMDAGNDWVGTLRMNLADSAPAA